MRDHGTVLVTGGAGFIGSAVTDALHEAGHPVRIFDNFSNSSRSRTSVRGIELIDADVRPQCGSVRSRGGLSRWATLRLSSAYASWSRTLTGPLSRTLSASITCSKHAASHVCRVACCTPAAPRFMAFAGLQRFRNRTEPAQCPWPPTPRARLRTRPKLRCIGSSTASAQRACASSMYTGPVRVHGSI